MKKLLLTICLLSFLVSVTTAKSLQNVLIVSIDALHPSALEMVELPTLHRLMQDGHYSLKGRSTTPPLTLLAHTAMFTGLGPTASGKTDNQWHSGNHRIKISTIFDDAKRQQYKTGYFYSKNKLGFLVNSAVDRHQLSGENSIDFALRFIKTPGKHFTFLHVSGLDYIGPRYGWLSPEYLEELTFIDEYLKPLVERIVDQQNYLIIVTSDHAGHDRIHGSNHVDDYRLPFIITSDLLSTSAYQGISYSVKDLKALLNKLIP